MKKLSLSVLIASTLLITACGDSQEATDSATGVGTAADIAKITQEYHDKMGTVESTVEAVAEATEGHVVGSAEDVAEQTHHYHKMMEALPKHHAAPAVGSAEEVAEQARHYHEQMKALSH